MKLIVGLGNPGEEYIGTRHNVGFWLVEAIAKQSAVEFKFDKKLNAESVKAKFNDKPVVLAKPCTYVNKSGEAVSKLIKQLKIKKEDLIVVQDDLDIEFGSLKLSFGKDSGGHRGIQSIIDQLKTNKFWRLRIGTANRKLSSARQQATLKAKKESVGNFVLAKFTPTEQTELKKILKQTLERLPNALH